MNKKLIAPIVLGVAVAVMLAIPISPPESVDQLQCSEDMGECFVAEVTRIVDGDTLEILHEERIRFALSSAPELNEPGGQDAKEFIEELCPVGSIVLVDEDDGQITGSYGRTIAQLTCNGINLNAKLISNGYGEIDTRYCDDSEFSEESWAAKQCGN
jgi:micrococcal nuclease